MHTGVISDAVLLSRHPGISSDTQALLGSRLLRALSHSRLPSLCRDWELQVDGGAASLAKHRLIKKKKHFFRRFALSLIFVRKLQPSPTSGNLRRVCQMHTIRPKTRSASGFQKINYKNHEFLIFSAYSFLFSGQQSLGSLPKATGIGMISFQMTEGCLYVKPAAAPEHTGKAL